MAYHCAYFAIYDRSSAKDLTQIFGRGKGNITRVTGSADFGALYQGTSTPVVLVGAMHGWAATGNDQTRTFLIYELRL